MFNDVFGILRGLLALLILSPLALFLFSGSFQSLFDNNNSRDLDFITPVSQVTLDISGTSFELSKIEADGAIFEGVETITEIGYANSYIKFEEEAVIRLGSKTISSEYSTTYSSNDINALNVTLSDFNEEYISLYPEEMTLVMPNGNKLFYEASSSIPI